MNGLFSRKDLVYTVYQEQSISKAAKKLFISQPSLSVMIKKIEDEIGFPLFDRTCKPLRMTEAGIEYIRATEEIMHIEKAFDNYAHAYKDLETGSLNLGSNQLLTSMVIPEIISAFMNKYPKIQINLVDDNSSVLESEIISGQLDLVIDNHKYEEEFFENRLITKEHLLMAVPSSFECNKGLEEYAMTDEDIIKGLHLTDRFKPLPAGAINDITFIAMTKENETRRSADDILKELKIKTNTILEIDRLVTLYRFVIMGTAASIVSDTLIRHTRQRGNVVFYRFDSKKATRDIYISYKKNKYYAKAMEAFVDMVVGMGEFI